MSIDRIYREFLGVALVIFSLFLFVSLITHSPDDNVANYYNTTDETLSTELDEVVSNVAVDNVSEDNSTNQDSTEEVLTEAVSEDSASNEEEISIEDRSVEEASVDESNNTYSNSLGYLGALFSSTFYSILEVLPTTLLLRLPILGFFYYLQIPQLIILKD